MLKGLQLMLPGETRGETGLASSGEEQTKG